MKANTVSLLWSIIVGVALIISSHFRLLQNIPAFSCNGFGCLGAGILLLVISLVLIPVSFGVLGFLFSKEKRFRQAVFSALISLVVMMIAVWITDVWNSMEVVSRMAQ